MVLLCAVWLLPTGFSACAVDSLWCKVAFQFTESAGPYGTLIIIFVTSFLYTIRITSWKEKVRNFLFAVIALSVFLGGFAALNEFVTKRAVHFTRPSHTYVITRSHQSMSPDSLYTLDFDQRRIFLKKLITMNDTVFNVIDPQVLEHWVEQAGYSFPSGHSFNAFLLACVLAFSILHLKHQSLRKFFFVPFIWAVMVAVSRVAIGVHSPLDVTFGAGLGLIVANTFIYFDRTRRWIIHKVHLDEDGNR